MKKTTNIVIVALFVLLVIFAGALFFLSRKEDVADIGLGDVQNTQDVQNVQKEYLENEEILGATEPIVVSGEIVCVNPNGEISSPEDPYCILALQSEEDSPKIYLLITDKGTKYEFGNSVNIAGKVSRLPDKPLDTIVVDELVIIE